MFAPLYKTLHLTFYRAELAHEPSFVQSLPTFVLIGPPALHMANSKSFWLTPDATLASLARVII